MVVASTRLTSMSKVLVFLTFLLVSPSVGVLGFFTRIAPTVVISKRHTSADCTNSGKRSTSHRCHHRQFHDEGSNAAADRDRTGTVSNIDLCSTIVAFGFTERECQAVETALQQVVETRSPSLEWRDAPKLFPHGVRVMGTSNVDAKSVTLRDVSTAVMDSMHPKHCVISSLSREGTMVTLGYAVVG